MQAVRAEIVVVVATVPPEMAAPAIVPPEMAAVVMVALAIVAAVPTVRLGTVRRSVVLLYVKAASAPNDPASLYWTCVSDPATAADADVCVVPSGNFTPPAVA